jgi:hypothetical protein
MKREIYCQFYDENGDIHFYTQKENRRRRDVYKNALNKCCWPNCPSGFNLATHHIVKIRAGGTDDYNNFIVLCYYCHSHHKLHNLGIDKKIELLVYKFYIEKLELGFCSDEMPNEDFQAKCGRIARRAGDSIENSLSLK